MLKIKRLKIDEIYSVQNIESIKCKFADVSNISNFNYYKLSSKAYQHSIEDQTKTNERNAYYNENFSKLLMKLCIVFVVWTKVMCKEININTDEDSFQVIDTYGKEFENHVFISNGSNVRVNEYLMTIIDYTDLKIQKAKSHMELKGTLQSKEKVYDNTYLCHEENWMGQHETKLQSNYEVSDSSNIGDTTSSTLSSTMTDELDSDGDFEELNINSVVDYICNSTNKTTHFLYIRLVMVLTKAHFFHLLL